ncbi:MAG: CRP/FNR family cyclic AMP-dependent transcriptional regulator [Acidimicrobiales bacterium]|jgi:CRP/FNR family cyclic AMP-dependent transcriptional regulator
MSLTDHADPKAARIHGLELFKEADRKALEHLASAADEAKVAAGYRLITQGHHHAEGYVVEMGIAEVLVDDVVVAEIGEGQMIGELAMFDRRPASATVRARTDMTLLVLPYNRIDQILEENPKMVRVLAEGLASRLRAMDANHF